MIGERSGRAKLVVVGRLDRPEACCCTSAPGMANDNDYVGEETRFRNSKQSLRSKKCTMFYTEVPDSVGQDREDAIVVEM